MDCKNLCFRSEVQCEYCRKNYIVGSDFYRARRPANNQWVTGYLIKNLKGELLGILNKTNSFNELAWILEGTLEKVSEGK